MPVSNVGVPSVTVPDPDTSFGASVTVPSAATIVVSGFKSHSASGALAIDPVTTSKVALYGAKLMVDDHACWANATIVVGFFCDSVYVVTCAGVNPLIANCPA